MRGEREGAPANMTCVSAIEAAWLPSLAEGSPLLSFSPPLNSPAPTYDASKHAVVCRVTPRYGVHAWELPPHPTELATAAPANRPDMVFRWFGRLLLEGGVVDGCLSELKAKEMLNDPPSLVTRERPAKKVWFASLFFFICYFCCFLFTYQGSWLFGFWVRFLVNDCLFFATFFSFG